MLVLQLNKFNNKIITYEITGFRSLTNENQGWSTDTGGTFFR